MAGACGVAGRRGMGRVAAGVAAGIALVAGLALPAAGQVDPSMELSLDMEVVWPAAGNAAPIYWRAFWLYQQNEGLKGVDWSEMLATDDASGYGLSASELARVREAEGAIGMALRAARVESCTWEVDYDQGIGALLPHLGPLRNMARLLAVDVRRCVQEEDLEGAVERLAALHALARHCRGDGILISSLVSCAISSLASAQTTELLAREALTPAQQDRLIAAIDAYGEDDPFAVRQAIGNEGVWLTAWLAQEVQAGRLGSQLDLLFNVSDASSGADVEKLKRLSDGAMIDELRRCRQYYTDSLAAWEERDASDRLELIGKLVAEGHYGMVANILAPALGKSYEADGRARATLASSRAEILADEKAPAPED